MVQVIALHNQKLITSERVLSTQSVTVRLSKLESQEVLVLVQSSRSCTPIMLNPGQEELSRSQAMDEEEEEDAGLGANSTSGGWLTKQGARFLTTVDCWLPVKGKRPLPLLYTFCWWCNWGERGGSERGESSTEMSPRSILCSLRSPMQPARGSGERAKSLAWW